MQDNNTISFPSQLPGRDYIFRVDDPVDGTYNVGRSAGTYDNPQSMQNTRFILRRFQEASDKMKKVKLAASEKEVVALLSDLFDKGAPVGGKVGRGVGGSGSDIIGSGGSGSGAILYSSSDESDVEKPPRLGELL